MELPSKRFSEPGGLVQQCSCLLGKKEVVSTKKRFSEITLSNMISTPAFFAFVCVRMVASKSSGAPEGRGSLTNVRQFPGASLHLVSVTVLDSM